MSKNQKKKKVNSSKEVVGFKKVSFAGGIQEYELTKNGLRVLFLRRPNTGVVSSGIVYHVGSRDEVVGETGLAHMLEHMVFKPTKKDLERKIDSGAMQFERETGIVLNANTWKDRTMYYFSYPSEYFETAIQVESERMRDVVLSDAEFLPERNNVLSEFDMYNGDPYFALEVVMRGTVFHSHPYGNETIGFRHDIEEYNTEKLQAFYDQYYWPNNATIMVVGDITESDMLKCIYSHFKSIPKATHTLRRHTASEAPQEGLRRVHVHRPSELSIFGLACIHDPFPTSEWFKTILLFDILTNGEDSVLHKALVDTGLATSAQFSLEPTAEKNAGILFVTATENTSLEKIEEVVFKEIENLSLKTIRARLPKVRTRAITNELYDHENSLGIIGDLTEYVAAGNWKAYNQTEVMISKVTPAEIHELKESVFTKSKLTIGYFRKET